MLDELLDSGEQDKWKAHKQVFQKLFETKDSDLILTITDLNFKDMEWSTALEILYSLLVERYIKSPKLMYDLKKLKDRIYLLRISKNRQGRQEGFQFFTEQRNRELKNMFGNLRGGLLQ